MDPVTAIGLLGSLANLIQASHSLLRIIKSLKDGERELLELLNDVALFDEALRGFDRVLRNRQTKHNISATVIQSALDEAFTTVRHLEYRLVLVSKYDTSAVRRIKWTQHKSTLKKLHDRLKEQSAMLQSFLALAHAETFLTACSLYPQFSQLSSLSEHTSQTVSSNEDEIASEVSTLASTSSTNSARRLSVSTTASSVESATASLEQPASSKSRSSSQSLSTAEDSLSQLTLRRACRYDCFCCCHCENVSGSEKFIRQSYPKLTCTDPNCQAPQTSKISEGPSKFFKKAMSQVLPFRSLKVRCSLNTFRMISEGSDAMRFVKHGNLEKLKFCISSGEATLWDTAPDGWSLLHTAAYNRQLPIVQYLLELGADTEVCDVGARKPGDLALLKSLADDATNVEHEMVGVFSHIDDYMVDFEFTPIHVAVLELYDPADRERPSLEKLLDFVDDCNNAPKGTDWSKWKSKYRKRSPLFGEIIERFRASTNERSSAQKVIHNLIDQKDRKFMWTPMHWASSAGQAGKMQILRTHGANPFLLSSLDANILHAAAESKTLKGLEYALEIHKRYPEKLDINQANRWSESPLHVASWGSAACVQLLLEAGADRNVRQEDNQVPLHCAGLSERGKIRRQIVKLLCSGGCASHLNAQDVDGRPPMFDFLDDPECLRILIEHGARLDLFDQEGRSAFHHACIQDENAGLQALLHYSPPNPIMITVKDHNGNTALIQALRNRSPCCALTLLAHAEIGDMVGQNGWAAVHHAAILGDSTVLEAVLKHSKFAPAMKTIDGKTADVVAMESENWCGDIKMLLRQHDTIS